MEWPVVICSSVCHRMRLLVLSTHYSACLFAVFKSVFILEPHPNYSVGAAHLLVLRDTSFCPSRHLIMDAEYSEPNGKYESSTYATGFRYIDFI